MSNHPGGEMKSSIIVVLFSLFLAGCAATGATYTEHLATSTSASAANARLVVFRTRDSVQYSARTASLKIDGSPVAGCDYAGFNVFDIKPGKHVVTVDMAASPGTCNLPIDVVAGKNYYLEIKPRTGSLMGTLAGGLIGAAVESSGKECGGAFSAEPVSEDVATPKLKDLKMTK